jgi:catechol 2,3-dioxygenase-like lactoylglutathione lyase family enzyme
VHLAPHPVWFRFVLLFPFVLPFLLWVTINTLSISIKPLIPRLKIAYLLSFIPYIFVAALDGHGNRRGWRLVAFSCFYTCWSVLMWAQRHSMSESLQRPGDQWFFPWKAASFSIPTDTRILVRSIDDVAPWYTEKLGLRRVAENPIKESDAATFRFKVDGNPIVLTTRSDFRTDKTPILFTRKIGKMRDVMMARGVHVKHIQRDRQGIQYFEIRDPEGNEIEVVEER